MKDRFNRKGLRNTHNTAVYQYNCGGYALNTFTWYTPCGFDFAYGDDSTLPYEYIGNKRATAACVRAILKDFPRLQLISNINDVDINAEVVAFRISAQEDFSDFHFMVRRDGEWSHKMGHDPIEVIDEQDALDEDNWFGDYFGELVLFVKI